MEQKDTMIRSENAKDSGKKPDIKFALGLLEPL